MIIKYDEESDSIYFIMSDEKSFESQEIEKDVIVDYGKSDDIVAIEVLKFKSNHKDLNIPLVGNFCLKQAS
jgi:uncharacterized protein YuzE